MNIGSMSAFFGNVVFIFLLLISVCAEGIYIYSEGKKQWLFICLDFSHTKGNYQKELADMYHIYAMDPRYKKKLETDFCCSDERKS